MTLGAILMLLAVAMAVVMGFFPEGFAWKVSDTEALLVHLAKGPVAAEIGIFAVIYLFIAACIIGGTMAIRQGMKIMAIATK